MRLIYKGLANERALTRIVKTIWLLATFNESPIWDLLAALWGPSGPWGNLLLHEPFQHSCLNSCNLAYCKWNSTPTKKLIGTILQKLYLFCESVASLHITISPLDDLCVNICFSVMLRSHEPRTRRNWVQRCTRWSLTTVWHKARLLHFLRSLVSQVFQVFCSQWWGECQGGNESLFKGKRHVPSFSSARKLATTPLRENTSFHIWGFAKVENLEFLHGPFSKRGPKTFSQNTSKTSPFAWFHASYAYFWIVIVHGSTYPIIPLCPRLDETRSDGLFWQVHHGFGLPADDTAFIIRLNKGKPKFQKVLRSLFSLDIFCKHCKNCECCHHHSLFKGHNVNVNIVVPNCQKCNQYLKCQVSGHKTREVLFEGVL